MAPCFSRHRGTKPPRHSIAERQQLPQFIGSRFVVISPIARVSPHPGPPAGHKNTRVDTAAFAVLYMIPQVTVSAQKRQQGILALCDPDDGAGIEPLPDASSLTGVTPAPRKQEFRFQAVLMIQRAAPRSSLAPIHYL